MRCAVCHRRLVPGAACPVDAGRPSDEATAPAVGPPPIPGVELGSLVGRGGFAEVYAAGARVVKVGGAAAAARFAREAQVLGALGPPLTPRLYAHGVAEGRPYLVMDRLDGAPLSAWMAALPGTGAATLSEAMARWQPIAATVARIHAAGFIHRDLKPENAFLAGGAATLIDFGLARAERDELPMTRDGERPGTACYMAPEQCSGAAGIDARADQYALAVLLFELLTGRPPFGGNAAEVMQGHLARRPPRASSLASLPAGLDEVLARALSKEPAARFADASAFATAVARVVADAAGSAGQAARSPASTRRPTAVLGVAAPAPLEQLAQLASADGGLLARVVGGRALFVFGGADVAAALRAAERAARGCAAALGSEATVVVHLAPLRLRLTAGRLVAAGPALERPDDWWPAVASGLHATGAARGELGVAPEAQAARSSEPTPPGAGAAAPSRRLYGRDRLLAQLAAEATDGFAAEQPTLSTVIGDVGQGKTRVLAALAEQLAALGVRVIALGEAAQAAPAPGRLIAVVLRHALGLPDGADATAVRRACEHRLARADAARWPAAALALGALDARDPAVAPLVAAPGALRYCVARQAGEALRRAGGGDRLALLVDDGHDADAEALDALEIATLAGAAPAIYVCVAARPGLTALRPTWGHRAGRARGHALAPLDGPDAAALARELLAPADFVPDPVVARLVELAQGNPLLLTELVNALRAAGAIRATPGGGDGAILAADDLLRLSTTPLATRLAERALAALPRPLVRFAEACAVLGGAITSADLEGLTDPADQLDPGVALRRLVRAGLLVERVPGRFWFCYPLLLEAVEARLPALDRRRSHELAFAALSARGASRERLARHAVAAELHGDAARVLLDLAHDARRVHRWVEAEVRYSAALAALARSAPPAPSCWIALAGRGAARYRLQRFAEALADLRAARALAEVHADPRAVAGLLLDEAIALDWLGDEAADTLVEAAAACAGDDAALAPRLALGRGRAEVHRGRFAAAVPLLSAAGGADDHETRVIALVLLGHALAQLDRLVESQAAFDAAIAGCEAAGDALHLGVALGNRVLLWIRRGDPAAAVLDLQRCVALARELGYVPLERITHHNLAEFLHWLGRDDEAAPLARHAHELQLRFFADRPTPLDALLVARIAIERGAADDARGALAWLDTRFAGATLSAQARALRDRVALALAPFDAAGWRRAVADSRTCLFDERLEIVHAAVRAAQAAGSTGDAEDFAAEAWPLAEASPLWRPRFVALAVVNPPFTARRTS